jgi:hypothetical protein
VSLRQRIRIGKETLPVNNSEFDVIVVGSGTCGATIARELVKQNKKVLVLEKGANIPLKETFFGIAAIAKEVPVGDNLNATTAFTVGGSTSIYFGVCKLPTSDTFAKLGIDLSEELEEVKRELPIAELRDEFLPPQSIVVRDSARELGYPMKKHPMLIDQSECAQGSYSYEAKWKAKNYIAEAIDKGASLISKAAVERVIVENGRAVGVQYQHNQGILGTRIRRAYGKKIVLSAGSLATPKLLIDCGIENVGDRGFFCKPAFMVFGTIPGLKGKDAFPGHLDFDLGNGVSIGDGAMTSLLFRLFMLSNRKWTRLFSHSQTVSVAILMNDGLSGEITKEGRYHKQLTAEEWGKLKSAEEIAVRILKSAGAKNIFRSKLVAGIPGGVLRINEHLDENLQTKISNLYVCDHSVMPNEKVTPVIPLVCLGKRLGRHLASSLQSPRMTAQEAPVVEETLVHC